eukprot:6179264-Pleurochrysis_carterae.AAC.4
MELIPGRADERTSWQSPLPFIQISSKFYLQHHQKSRFQSASSRESSQSAAQPLRRSRAEGSMCTVAREHAASAFVPSNRQPTRLCMGRGASERRTAPATVTMTPSTLPSDVMLQHQAQSQRQSHRRKSDIARLEINKDRGIIPGGAGGEGTSANLSIKAAQMEDAVRLLVNPPRNQSLEN